MGCVCVRVTYNNRTFKNPYNIFLSISIIQNQRKQKENLIDTILFANSNFWTRTTHTLERWKVIMMLRESGPWVNYLTSSFCVIHLWPDPLELPVVIFLSFFFFNCPFLTVQYRYSWMHFIVKWLYVLDNIPRYKVIYFSLVWPRFMKKNSKNNRQIILYVATHQRMHLSVIILLTTRNFTCFTKVWKREWCWNY